jgi:transcriptional regulator with XRE-family HTH domain
MTGELIRTFRTQQGMTQEQLAEKAGISRVSLSKIENSEVLSMSAKTAVSIARALNVTTDVLLCFEC